MTDIAAPAIGGRACVDCSRPVSAKSTRRCRRCANAIVNRDPAHRAASAETMRLRMADPDFYAEHVQRTRRGTEKAMLRPEVVAARRLGGLKAVATNLHKGRTAEARAKAGPSISAAKLAHVPESYRALYRSLRSRNWSAAKRLAYVLARKAEDERKQARFGTSPDMAAQYLQRSRVVYRTDANGRQQIGGTHWRVGSLTLSPEQIIDYALERGWQPHAWSVAA